MLRSAPEGRLGAWRSSASFETPPSAAPQDEGLQLEAQKGQYCANGLALGEDGVRDGVGATAGDESEGGGGAAAALGGAGGFCFCGKVVGFGAGGTCSTAAEVEGGDAGGGGAAASTGGGVA